MPASTQGTVPHRLTWGAWVITRAHFVGLALQRDLAREVGCRVEQISRYARMARPPKIMRKGFDASLVRALQTSREMLFDRWRETPPEDAPRTLFHADQYLENIGATEFIHTEEEDLLKKLIDHLLPSETESAIEYVVTLVLAANDERAAHFRPIAESFKKINRADKRRRVYTVKATGK